MQMMKRLSNLIFALLTLVVFASKTHQLRSEEIQILLQLRKHLEYPKLLEVWENNNGDLCSSSSPPNLLIKCENDAVTALRITGNYKNSKVSNEFRGYSIPNRTLSQHFSIDSFVTTLTRLSNLRAISLVSLGIWGELPEKIHRLYSLEALDMSSNYMYNSIPYEISRLTKLKTLTFDGNYFNDTFPEWLDSLSNLTILSLKNNILKSKIPSSVSRITSLIEVDLSNNLLYGELPDLSGLSSLQLLDLRNNFFGSELPPLPSGLANIFLSNNSFSGRIPEQFGEMNKLQHLDLSGNYLSGFPPVGVFSLPNISYLNLSLNALSGSFSEKVKCGDVLSLIDLSNNRFTGELPSWLDSDSGNRIVRVSGNCFSIDEGNQNPEAYCNKGKRASTMKEISILGGVVGGVVIIVAILLFVGLLIFCKRRRKQDSFVVQHVAPKVKQVNPPPGISSELFANARLISEASKMGNPSALSSHKVFAVEELEEATKNFDQTNFLGEGSLGKVYKGMLENGTVVAIRCMTLSRKYSVRNLTLQLDMLSKLRHPHLVGLLGHCSDGGTQEDLTTIHKLFLVQEYLPNGNFRSHLSETSPEKVLKWSDRLAILINVAKAVHFLHTGVIPPCPNNRLKTNNILLDEHRVAKLSDYGMSIIANETEKFEAKGDAAKPGHVENDVYDFGLILLESLVGPNLNGKQETFLLNEMTSFSSQDGRRKIVDPIVLTTSTQESLSIAVSITNKCISHEPSSRPSFEDVLWNLQYAAQVQTAADSDQKSETLSPQSYS